MLDLIIPHFLKVHRAEVDWMYNHYLDRAAEMQRFKRSMIGRPNFTFVVYMAYLPMLIEDAEKHVPDSKDGWIEAWDRYLDPKGCSRAELLERYTTFFKERGADHGAKVIASEMAKYLVSPNRERMACLEIGALEGAFFKPKDAEEVMSFYARFPKMQMPYNKRIPQLLLHECFKDRVMVDEDIKDIGLAAGWTLTDQEMEKRLVALAGASNIEPWFLDLLLVDFKDRWITMIKEY